MGVSELHKNLLEHPLKIREHFLIPKSDHTIASRTQEPSAPNVLCDLPGIFSVLRAIELDHQLALCIAKVRDKFADWKLPPKREACQLIRTQPRPQMFFRDCLLPPQRPRQLMNH